MKNWIVWTIRNRTNDTSPNRLRHIITPDFKSVGNEESILGLHPEEYIDMCESLYYNGHDTTVIVNPHTPK